MKKFSWFLLGLFRDFLRYLKMKWRFYRDFGMILPAGARILAREGVAIGRQFTLGAYCEIVCQDPERGSNITIGNRVALNTGVIVNADCGGRISIGNDVLLGPGVVLRAASHCFKDLNVPIRDQGHVPGVIVIEEDVWLGANVVVLPDVRIGRSSVVGAGSVVTKDIPPFSVAVGVPAKVIRSRKE